MSKDMEIEYREANPPRFAIMGSMTPEGSAVQWCSSMWRNIDGTVVKMFSDGAVYLVDEGNNIRRVVLHPGAEGIWANKMVLREIKDFFSKN